MADLDLSGGIRMEAQDLGSQAGIAAELSLHTGQTPFVAVQATDDAFDCCSPLSKREAKGMGLGWLASAVRVTHTDHKQGQRQSS
jgi:hypothetical protein